MARKRERAFAAFGAALFIITSSALSIAAVFAIYQQSKTATPTPKATNQSKTTEKNVNKLAGTPLSNFTPVSSIPKLETIDTTPGTGAVVQPGATVTVDYTGAVAATGIIFQSSLDTGQTVSFGLDQVIAGWTQGIPGMKVGGTRRLLIPASLAYGANPPSGSGIPANADLVFDVTVHATK
jgi:FKBP-type peptidyl-prolyl cis-trans isomerase